MDSSRLVFFGIWGVGVIVIYGIVIVCRWQIWRHHHDKRSFRDFLEGFALWLVAFGASAAVASVILYPDASTIRGFLNSLALGAFFGAGVVMATDALEQRRGLKARRK